MVESQWRNVVEEEQQLIRERRKCRGDLKGFTDDKHFFGIALSGGGVRSATVCLGVLQVLNKCGVLKQADYLSTVSGGGYLGGYVSARLNWLVNDPGAPPLFSEMDEQGLRRGARYLTPGGGLAYSASWLRLITSVGTSVLLNTIWILAALACITLLLAFLWSLDPQFGETVRGILIVGSGAVLLYHLIGHLFRRQIPWSLDYLIAIEAAFLLVAVLCVPLFISAILEISALNILALAVFAALISVVVGFFSDPNVLGLHRFYRNRIADTYLKAGAPDARNLRLHELWTADSAAPVNMPYPLINTCVTLMSEPPPDERKKTLAEPSADNPVAKPAASGTQNRKKKNQQLGRRAADYFLLSPLYSGSKLTEYARTQSLYTHLKLSNAIATSGAAVNPGMGIHTQKFRSFLMALLGIRLGLWVKNPHSVQQNRGKLLNKLTQLPWWPYYHLLELMGRTDSRQPYVNLSDGGNIENLGIFELIRRRCKLIIAIDATADPAYKLADLNNLVLRARHELGVAIDFRGTPPEEIIRPKPSTGTSQSHFVVGTLSDLGGKPNAESEWGILVYVKSSIRQQKRWRTLEDYQEWYKPGHDYKNNHPSFPHESTTDQFFDDDQWTAYFQLGRFIAGDLLQQDVRRPEWWGDVEPVSVPQLCDRLAGLSSFNKLDAYISPVDDAKRNPEAQG